jgi:hypothetical protein
LDAYHVGFEQHSFNENFVIIQEFEQTCKHFFGNHLSHFDAVGAVREHFGLHDRHESVELANGCIAGQNPSVFEQGELRRGVFVDFENAPPLRESEAFDVKM